MVFQSILFNNFKYRKIQGMQGTFVTGQSIDPKAINYRAWPHVKVKSSLEHMSVVNDLDGIGSGLRGFYIRTVSISTISFIVMNHS